MFAPDDHISILTSVSSFRVNLVGASTYDSDITYDGLVAAADFDLLDSVLTNKWPTQDTDSGFDPTKDMNVRFPNAADDVKQPDPWPLTGPPPREIGLGDFAPLNVEFDLNSPVQGRARAPFLDLDTDNS
jgi:hypothetical protein